MRALHPAPLNPDDIPEREKTPRPTPPHADLVHELAPTDAAVPLSPASLAPEVVHDPRPPSFASISEALNDLSSPIYLSADAPPVKSHIMSESRPPGSTAEQTRPRSRGRSHSQAVNPSRRPPIRPHFPPPPPPPIPPGRPYSSHVSTSAESNPTASNVNSPPSFGQQDPYMGQYGMSTNVMHQPQQYAYAHHPGMYAPDTNMHPQNQLMGYSTNNLIPMMQPHTSVYQYPVHSSEVASSASSQNFAGGPVAMYPSHSHSSAHQSSPPRSPLNPQGSHGHPLPPPHSTPYAGQTPYSPLRYSTPPFAYPSHSFAPSPPVYQPQFASPHYPQAYTPPSDQDRQGTWWYMPPTSRPSSQYESYQTPYLSYSPVVPREMESYSQSGHSLASSPLYHMPPAPTPAPHPSQAPPPTLNLPPLATSPIAPSVASSAGSRQNQPEVSPPSHRPSTDRPQPARRNHPNPPAQRSEWVMWTGNVPSDATHDELWRFLNQGLAPGLTASRELDEDAAVSGGVMSIFLISRSNCAFVNFQSDTHLQTAIQRFNGQSLRPADPRCPRLVCRVRGRDDDLKAGVGGQRNTGIHVRWINEQKDRARGAQGLARRSTSLDYLPTPTSSPGDPATMLASLSLSSDDERSIRSARTRRPEQHSSSSGSFASTNSSILTRHFPKRYFILKSLTQDDLDLSVREGLWATQRHNEGTLEQAFRTSDEVYLIFGVNKSGEFFGYARMAGPIMHGEHSQISWSARTESPPQRRTSRQSQSPKQGSTSGSRDHPFFSPSEQRFDDSPMPMSAGTTPDQPPADDAITPRVDMDHAPHGFLNRSAPAELHQPHLPLGTPSARVARQHASLDHRKHARLSRQADSFDLDPAAPLRAMREHSAPPDPTLDSEASEELTRRWDAPPLEALPSVAEEDEKRDVAVEATTPAAEADGPVWGESFKVEWLRTARLPFYRTRHLRNPWNHDREVKVSRDGTELEPSVGQALLDEWDVPNPPPPPAASEQPRGGGRVTAPSTEEGEGG